MALLYNTLDPTLTRRAWSDGTDLKPSATTALYRGDPLVSDIWIPNIVETGWTYGANLQWVEWYDPTYSEAFGNLAIPLEVGVTYRIKFFVSIFDTDPPGVPQTQRLNIRFGEGATNEIAVRDIDVGTWFDETRVHGSVHPELYFLTSRADTPTLVKIRLDHLTLHRVG